MKNLRSLETQALDWVTSRLQAAHSLTGRLLSRAQTLRRSRLRPEPSNAHWEHLPPPLPVDLGSGRGRRYRPDRYPVCNMVDRDVPRLLRADISNDAWYRRTMAALGEEPPTRAVPRRKAGKPLDIELEEFN